MSDRARALTWSVGLHVGMLFLLAGIGASIPAMRAPIVVDLTLHDGREAAHSLASRETAPVPGVPAATGVAPAAEAPAMTEQRPAALPDVVNRERGLTLPAVPPQSARPAFPVIGDTERAGQALPGKETMAEFSARHEGAPRPGPGGEAAVAATSADPVSRFAYIRETIQREIRYPSVARRMGWEGNVVVSFSLLADGNVRDVRVVRSSGFPLLDRSALEAVRSASPFPRPPAEAAIITPVAYTLR